MCNPTYTDAHSQQTDEKKKKKRLKTQQTSILFQHTTGKWDDITEPQHIYVYVTF